MRRLYTTIFQAITRKAAHPEFENLMRRASELYARGNLRGLQDLQKIVLRPVQSLHVRDAYLKADNTATCELAWPDALGITCFIPWSNSTFSYHVAKHLRPTLKVQAQPLNLATDIILPTCWHPSSIIGTLGMIGENLPAGAFKQSANHRVVYTHPLGIGWVDNGNHSIAQAIIRGNGFLNEYAFVDITDLIMHIRYDGFEWRILNTNENAGQPRYPEFGWAWELGRMIAKLEGRL